MDCACFLCSKARKNNSDLFETVTCTCMYPGHVPACLALKLLYIFRCQLHITTYLEEFISTAKERQLVLIKC